MIAGTLRIVPKMVYALMRVHFTESVFAIQAGLEDTVKMVSLACPLPLSRLSLSLFLISI